MLIVVVSVDCDGNLYIGLNIEDMLIVVEVIVFKDGIVIV